MEVYQYGAGTVANRALVQDNTQALIPDNCTITAATLTLTASYEGSGGTNPMPVKVYSVSGTLPNLATVTWNTWAGTLSAALDTTNVTLSGNHSWNILPAVQAAYAARSSMVLALDGGPDSASDTNRILTSPVISITYTQLTPEGIPVSAPGRFRVSKLRGAIR
jgi:hypothetical protein